MAKREKIRIDDLEYALPEKPAKEEILFHDKGKLDQYWRRQEDFPQIFFDYNPFTIVNAVETRYDVENSVLISLSVADTAELKRLQNREMHRRVYGVWFMNKGVATYLTGVHYFILQWCQVPDVPGNYLGYRKFQRNFFYAWDLCEHDEDCLGLYVIKPKKTGLTQLVSLIFLEKSTRMKEKRFGMMSKSKDDARDTNFMFYLFALNKLPYIFRPRAAKETETRRIFALPRKKDTGTRSSVLAQLKNDTGFNTEVFVAPTVVDAFDGPKLELGWFDEFPKYDDPSPEKVFTKCSQAVKIDHDINGKIIITSYVVETDGKEFDEAKKIFEESELSTKTVSTNRTISGLYTHFISALDSGNKLFDVYGDCDTETRRGQILAEREQKKYDSNALQAIIRQYPITKEEAWRKGGASGSAFNNIRLGERDKEISDGMASGQLPFVPGYFRWKNGMRLGEVEFVPVPQETMMEFTDKEIDTNKSARFRWYMPNIRPADFMPNKPFLNANRDRRGRLKPFEDTLFCGAADPFDYALKEDVAVGSKGAITIELMPHTPTNTIYGINVTGRMVIDYLFRHDDPDDYYEDLIMLVLYFGMYVYVESNKPWVTKKMKDEGLQNFILYRTKEKTVEPFVEGAEMVQTATNKDVIEELCLALANEISAPAEGSFDLLKLYYSKRLIKQLMEFKPTDTKRYDLAMCWGLNKVARNSLQSYRLRVANHKGRYDRSTIETMFNHLVRTG